jgi:hypothetical protein
MDRIRRNHEDLGNNFSYNLITAQPGMLFMSQRHKCVTKLNSDCSISWKAGIREISWSSSGLETHRRVWSRSACSGNTYERTPWSRDLLERLIVAHLLKHELASVKFYHSSPRLQKPATGPYPEPKKCKWDLKACGDGTLVQLLLLLGVSPYLRTYTDPVSRT